MKVASFHQAPQEIRGYGVPAFVAGQKTYTTLFVSISPYAAKSRPFRSGPKPKIRKSVKITHISKIVSAH